MRNLRLWDHDPQLTTFQQLQEIRTYYDFVSVFSIGTRLIRNFARSLFRPENSQRIACQTRTG